MLQLKQKKFSIFLVKVLVDIHIYVDILQLTMLKKYFHTKHISFKSKVVI